MREDNGSTIRRPGIDLRDSRRPHVDVAPGYGSPAPRSACKLCKRQQVEALVLHILIVNAGIVLLPDGLRFLGTLIHARKGDHTPIRRPPEATHTRRAIRHLLNIPFRHGYQPGVTARQEGNGLSIRRPLRAEDETWPMVSCLACPLFESAR